MMLRLPPQLIEQLKHNAKRDNLSLNAYVEMELEMIAKPKIPKLPKDFKVSPLVESLSGIIPAPSKELLESDDRLAYILSK